MHHENTIRLSGPFRLHDSLGRAWEIEGIRIFDEGYGIIDVYVDFAASMEDAPLFEDALVIRQILARLRALGYAGPDFGPGDPGQQDDRLIVLEAPEAFSLFAASKGWKNLAEEYADEHDDASVPQEVLGDPDARGVFDALMQKMRRKP
ncbi:hypothetical protein [Noviherbaspirillum sedimenti]|uniref:hypothetical protein n=1 Tax=Noviherbaspirillum sedimenti TaxID=2320865 RepID=UPI001F2AE4ED|nr:hypothetical protein [Noviherbaspirillum sedimenti]